MCEIWTRYRAEFALSSFSENVQMLIPKVDHSNNFDGICYRWKCSDFPSNAFQWHTKTNKYIHTHDAFLANAMVRKLCAWPILMHWNALWALQHIKYIPYISSVYFFFHYFHSKTVYALVHVGLAFVSGTSNK